MSFSWSIVHSCSVELSLWQQAIQGFWCLQNHNMVHANTTVIQMDLEILLSQETQVIQLVTAGWRINYRIFKAAENFLFALIQLSPVWDATGIRDRLFFHNPFARACRNCQVIFVDLKKNRGGICWFYNPRKHLHTLAASGCAFLHEESDPSCWEPGRMWTCCTMTTCSRIWDLISSEVIVNPKEV